MGPIWDFDWAFSYDEDTELHFKSYSNSTLNPNKTGSIFFLRILQDPIIKTLFKQKWTSFKSSKFPALLQYVDEYGKLIKESQRRDVERWDRGSKNFDLEVKKMKSWLQGRANYMDSFVADL